MRLRHFSSLMIFEFSLPSTIFIFRKNSFDIFRDKYEKRSHKDNMQRPIWQFSLDSNGFFLNRNSSEPQELQYQLAPFTDDDFFVAAILF